MRGGIDLPGLQSEPLGFPQPLRPYAFDQVRRFCLRRAVQPASRFWPACRDAAFGGAHPPLSGWHFVRQALEGDSRRQEHKDYVQDPFVESLAKLSEL